MKKVLIVGSSRNDGQTTNLSKQLVEKSGWDLINLNDYEFSYFDYEHKNRDDDYLNLMQQIAEKYETLIFVTPIYWYSMSGIMKVFFDRLTDLLTIEKQLGRKLRGKKIAVITSSVGENLGDNFWLPFQETAKYLGMEFIVGCHTIEKANNTLELENFIFKLNK